MKDAPVEILCQRRGRQSASEELEDSHFFRTSATIGASFTVPASGPAKSTIEPLAVQTVIGEHGHVAGTCSGRRWGRQGSGRYNSSEGISMANV